MKLSVVLVLIFCFEKCSAACPTEGIWPSTAAGQTAYADCHGGKMTRLCSVTNHWGTPDGTNCLVHLSEACDLGQQCLDDSHCFTSSLTGGKMCQCVAPRFAMWEGVLDREICKMAPTYVGDSCSQGEYCSGYSVCDGNICACEEGFVEKVERDDGKKVCAPEAICAPSEVTVNGHCVLVTDSVADFDMGMDTCSDFGSQLLAMKTENDWAMFHEKRVELQAANPVLENIWIGLRYDKAKKLYVWTDGTELDYAEDYLPDKLKSVLDTRYPTPAAHIMDHCGASQSNKSYEWEFVDCSSYDYYPICYSIPKTCPKDGIWNSKRQYDYANQACNGGHIYRHCEKDGLWALPFSQDCIAYVDESCSFGQKCQGDSICVTNQNRTDKICQCPLGKVPQFDGILNKYTCAQKEVYVGDVCFHGEICQGGSICHFSVCQCLELERIEIDPTTGNKKCVPPKSYVAEPCYLGQECEGGSQCLIENTLCLCPDGKKPQFDDSVNKTVCVDAFFCPASFPWSKTLENELAEVECEIGGHKKRQCSSVGTWGAIDSWQCQAYFGEECIGNQTCFGRTECVGSACHCEQYEATVLDPGIHKHICMPAPAYVEESCSHGEICMGGSVCQNTMCSCPEDLLSYFDAELQKRICVPVGICYDAEVQMGSKCLKIQSASTNWFDARAACVQAESKLSVTKSQEEWYEFNALRLDRIAAGETYLQNIWVGLYFNDTTHEFEFTDGTSLAESVGDEFLPDRTNGNCAASCEVDAYEWKFIDCNTPEIYSICYQGTKHCAAMDGWPKTLEGGYTERSCPDGEGLSYRICQYGGYWLQPANYNCKAYVEEPCTYEEKCQANSYCTTEQGTEGKICKCQSGHREKLDTSLGKKVCIPNLIYADDSCALGEMCAGNSDCTGVICECPTASRQETDGDGNQICVLTDAYVTEPCTSGQSCQDGSICYEGTCQCKPGKVPEFNMDLNRFVCRPMESYAEESCALQQTCVGGSQCQGHLCLCPPGRVAEIDPLKAKKVCVIAKSKPTESCVDGELCTGDSLCMGGVCTCPIYLPELYKDECLRDFARLFEVCNSKQPCLGMTKGECVEARCICAEPRYYDVRWGKCSSNETMAEGQSAYGQSCMHHISCIPEEKTVCDENICACVPGLTFREGTCMEPGECTNPKHLYYEDEDACRMPREGEYCEVECEPYFLLCFDSVCTMPMGGDMCDGVCYDIESMECGVSDSRCHCKPGYMEVENKTCVEQPARPEEPCSPKTFECTYGGKCNFNSVKCFCPVGTEARDDGQGLECLRKRNGAGESCKHNETCIHNSECDADTLLCACPLGTLQDGLVCNIVYCPQSDPWPKTLGYSYARMDCQPGSYGQRYRHCDEFGDWEFSVDLCIKPAKFAEFMENSFPNYAEDPEACLTVMDILLSIAGDAKNSIKTVTQSFNGMTVRCPTMYYETVEASYIEQLSEKYMSVVEYLLGEDRISDLESDPAAATEFLFANERVALAMGQRYFVDAQHQEEPQPLQHSVLNMVIENHIVRPGQSHDALTASSSGSCFMSSETLRSPGLLSHKDKFSLSCVVANLTVPIEPSFSPPAGSVLKMVPNVVSAVTDLNMETTRDVMINLRFHLTESTPIENIHCGWLQENPETEMQRFDTTGCTVLQNLGLLVSCKCTHTTNYAMLIQIDPDAEPSKHIEIVKWLSTFMYILSLIFLFVASCILLYIRNLLTQRIFILRNMAIVLFCLQLGLLILLHVTLSESKCRLSAVVLHFLLLSFFAWLLALAVCLQILLRRNPDHVLVKYPPSIVYSVMGFVIPLLIVVIAAASQWDGYGVSEHFGCWMQNSGLLPLAAILPVSVVILITVVIIFSTCVTMKKSLDGIREDHFYSKSIFGSLKFLTFMTTVLSTCWIAGFIFFTSSGGYWTMRYLFAILNGVIGILFFFLIIANQEVREALRQQREDYDDLDDENHPVLREDAYGKATYHQ